MRVLHLLVKQYLHNMEGCSIWTSWFSLNARALHMGPFRRPTVRDMTFGPESLNNRWTRRMFPRCISIERFGNDSCAIDSQVAKRWRLFCNQMTHWGGNCMCMGRHFRGKPVATQTYMHVCFHDISTGINALSSWPQKVFTREVSFNICAHVWAKN